MLSSLVAVTLNLNILYISEQCVLFNDPIVFVLNLGLPTSKKEERAQCVIMCVCLYNNHFGNTFLIPAQVTKVWFDHGGTTSIVQSAILQSCENKP